MNVPNRDRSLPAGHKTLWPPPTQIERTTGRVVTISDTEAYIVLCCVDGLRDHEIAPLLGLTASGVNGIRKRFMKRCGFRNQAAMGAWWGEFAGTMQPVLKLAHIAPRLRE